MESLLPAPAEAVIPVYLDAGEPLRIVWFDDSYIDIPIHH